MINNTILLKVRKELCTKGRCVSDISLGIKFHAIVQSRDKEEKFLPPNTVVQNCKILINPFL